MTDPQRIWYRLARSCNGFWVLEDSVRAVGGEDEAKALQAHLEELTVHALNSTMSWEEFQLIAAETLSKEE